MVRVRVRVRGRVGVRDCQTSRVQEFENLTETARLPKSGAEE